MTFDSQEIEGREIIENAFRQGGEAVVVQVPVGVQRNATGRAIRARQQRLANAHGHLP